MAILFSVFFAMINLIDSGNVTLSCFKTYCFKLLTIDPILPLDCGDELWPLELINKESFEDFKTFWGYENNRSVLLNIWQFQSQTLFWDINAKDLTEVQHFNYRSDQFGIINNNGSITIATERDKKYFVCKYYLDNEICLQKDHTLLKFGNHCFVLSETKETWIKARSDCLERNGDLMTLDKNTNNSLNPLCHFREGCWIKFRNKAWIWLKSRGEVNLPGLRTLISFKSSLNIVVLNPGDLGLRLEACGSDIVSVVCMINKTSTKNSLSVEATVASASNKSVLREKRDIAKKNLAFSESDMYSSTWGVEKHMYISMSVLAVVLAFAITLMESGAEASKRNVLRD